MAVKSRAVTVATTATQLDSTTDPHPHGGAGAPWLAFNNTSAVTVYVGGADVSTANGFPVAASAVSPAFGLGEGEAIYGIVAADTAAIRVIETGV